jgi:hypothetical protein
VGVTVRVIRNKIVTHTENWERKRERQYKKKKYISVGVSTDLYKEIKR